MALSVAEITQTQKQAFGMTQVYEDKLTKQHNIDIVLLEKACQVLPPNYSFEIPKTLLRILDWKKETKNIEKHKVSLQFPEGLLLYSTIISDILENFASIECLIMGDVTYGACCIDDLASKALGCEFIVHYGHSCLVSISNMSIPNVLYVFVEIAVDMKHLIETLGHNLQPDQFNEKKLLYVMGVIQFNKTLLLIKKLLVDKYGFNPDYIRIPQTKPRSGGEVLGCTSPVLEGEEGSIVVFISDGRFHIESTMIRNPTFSFYQYNPYDKKFTEEVYEVQKMHQIRKSEVEKAKGAQFWGIILGTLGRQGSTSILEQLEELMKKNNKKYVVIYISEISLDKIKRFTKIQAWIQISCPRLSIDWGHHCHVPFLNPYEAFTAMNEIEWQKVYPMDYYSYEGGKWSNYFKEQEERKKKLDQKRKEREQKKKIKLEYEEQQPDGSYIKKAEEE